MRSVLFYLQCASGFDYPAAASTAQTTHQEAADCFPMVIRLGSGSRSIGPSDGRSMRKIALGKLRWSWVGT
jgi:hypothetical protein